MNRVTPMFIVPNWPASSRVRALSTTRIGGASSPPYHSFNLGLQSGDDPGHVQKNRALLRQHGCLPGEPQWLNQVHSSQVIEAGYSDIGHLGDCADAIWSLTANSVCAVMTADCLPVLFAAQDGSVVAAAHAGWRGLASGILEATVAALPTPADRLLAWLGPCIGRSAFEVGDDVRDAFAAIDRDLLIHFTPREQRRWLADLRGLALARLHVAGVRNVYADSSCTYSEAERFFSYRRDGASSGRMASVIWLETSLCPDNR